MNAAVKNDANKNVLEIASAWSDRLRAPDCSDDDVRRFEAWLGEDPSHAAAFDEVEALFALVSHHAGDPQLQALRATAHREVAARRRADRIRPTYALAAALILGAFVSAGFVVAWQMSAGPAQEFALPIYEAGIGERRLVTLADGSAVTLNTNSRIEVDYSENARRVLLVRGQAFFEVFPDAARPFIAEAGSIRVHALGTAFDVRRDSADALEVTLVEGRVGVSTQIAGERAASASAHSIELVPGERLALRSGRAPEVTSPDLAAITAWQKGMIVFQAASLAEVVKEMNRYNAEKLILSDDARFEDIELTGVFRTDDVLTVISALEARFPLRAERSGFNEWTLVPRD